jgi:hypothetical protein
MSTHPKVRGKKIPSQAGIVSLTGDFFPSAPAAATQARDEALP